MILTPTQVYEAEAACRQQRQSFQPLLRIDTAKATPRETEIHARVLAAKDFDQVIADPAVSSMFRRGVLFFGAPT